MLTLKYLAYAYLFISFYHALKFVDDPEFRKVKQDKFLLELMHPAFRGLMFFILLFITAISWPLGTYYDIKASYGNWRARKIMESILREQRIGMEPTWPVYQCHKQVRAFKIGSILPLDNPDTTGQSAAESYGAYLLPKEKSFAVRVPPEYMTKHNPQIGGYYVMYDNGYYSFSPAKAFEEGYTRIDTEDKDEKARRNRILACGSSAIANVKSAEHP